MFNWYENLTIGKLWEIMNTQFSLIGVVCFMILSYSAIRLFKKSINLINFIATLPVPLLAGGSTAFASGMFGYAVMDFFSKSPYLSGQMNGFLMSASITIALVALKYEKQVIRKD
jgi:hypothetical protein